MKKIFLLVLLCAVPIFSAIRVVPTTYATVQDAITAADAGDTISLASDTITLTAFARSKGGILVRGDGPSGWTVLNVGDFDGFRIEHSAVRFHDIEFRFNVPQTDYHYLITTLGELQGGYEFIDCYFNRGADNTVYGNSAIYFTTDNYLTFNHNPSYFKRCLFHGFGLNIGISGRNSLRNVVIDSCVSDTGNHKLTQGWSLLNSVQTEFFQNFFYGDSTTVRNCYFSYAEGETFSWASVGDYPSTGNKISRITAENCNHTLFEIDGVKNSTFDSISFGSTSNGLVYIMALHDNDVYDSVDNVQFRNVNNYNNYFGIMRGPMKNVLYEKFFWPSTSSKVTQLFKSSLDTLKNSVISFPFDGSDSIASIENVRYGFQPAWQLDTTVFGFTKIKYIDSTYGTNHRQTIIVNTDTTLGAQSIGFSTQISDFLRHDNRVYIWPNFYQKNTFYTGDTAKVTLLYKEHSSGTWLTGQADTGVANEVVNLSLSSLLPSTEYDATLKVEGLSSGTTHMIDTTTIYTFTTDGPTTPVIDSIRPAKIYYGKSLSYYGKNLGTLQGSGKLFFGDYNLSDSVYLWSATRIDVKTDSATIRGWYHSLLVTDGGDTIIPIDSVRVFRPYWR